MTNDRTVNYASEDAERKGIRDAMKRLIDGEPIRSDGKLTIKALAEEAGIKRWRLTHKHTDLQTEFRDRMARINSVPRSVQNLLDKQEAAEGRIEQLAAELRQAREELRVYARIVNVLTVENLEKDRRLKELSTRLASYVPQDVPN